MEDVVDRLYFVELLYEQPPTLDKDAFLRTLRQNGWNIEVKAGKPNILSFSHEDFADREEEVPSPLIMYLLRDQQVKVEKLEPSLQQSWEWMGARHAVTACKWMVSINDMLASHLPHRERIAMIHNAVEVAVELTSPKAIHFPMSQQVLDPKLYYGARQMGEERDELYGIVNVRFYNIVDGPAEEMLMDTIGLSVLGLPDIQCRFVNLDPNMVSMILYNLAYYQYDHGDVIVDGDAIEGIDPDDHWVCKRGTSLLEPKRAVIELDTGTLIR